MRIDIYDEHTRSMWNLRKRSLEPLTYIRETEDQVIVEMDLPMVKKEDINLRLANDALEVEATLNRSISFHAWGTVQRRHEFKHLYKSVSLPSPVTPEESRATYKMGILRVELKKKKEKKHKIPIK